MTSGHGLMRRQSGACRHGESEHTVSGLPYDALGLIPSFGALAPRPVPQQSPRWPVRNGETTRTPGKSTLLNPDQAHVQRGDPLGLAPLGPSHALRRGQGVWLWMVGPRALGVSLSFSPELWSGCLWRQWYLGRLEANTGGIRNETGEPGGGGSLERTRGVGGRTDFQGAAVLWIWTLPRGPSLKASLHDAIGKG